MWIAAQDHFTTKLADYVSCVHQEPTRTLRARQPASHVLSVRQGEVYLGRRVQLIVQFFVARVHTHQMAENHALNVLAENTRQGMEEAVVFNVV